MTFAWETSQLKITQMEGALRSVVLSIIYGSNKALVLLANNTPVTAVL